MRNKYAISSTFIASLTRITHLIASQRRHQISERVKYDSLLLIFIFSSRLKYFSGDEKFPLQQRYGVACQQICTINMCFAKNGNKVL